MELCDIGLDMVDVIHLAVVLEERFNVKIDNADISALDSMTARQIAGWLTVS